MEGKKKTKQVDMLHGSLLDKILLFALPLAASSILQQLFNSVDVAVVGRFASSQAQAAVGNGRRRRRHLQRERGADPAVLGGRGGRARHQRRGAGLAVADRQTRLPGRRIALPGHQLRGRLRAAAGAVHARRLRHAGGERRLRTAAAGQHRRRGRHTRTHRAAGAAGRAAEALARVAGDGDQPVPPAGARRAHHRLRRVVPVSR